MGGGSFGTYTKSADEIINGMAMKLRNMMVPTINDFFIRFDGHERRVYEPWELSLMFNEISKEEAQGVCS